MAYGIVSEFGVNFKQTVKYFKEFKGVKRRLELIANISDIKIYDDFAHHPTAIKKLSKLSEIRQGKSGHS